MAFLIIIAVVVIGLILKSCSEKKTFEKEINDYKRKYEMEFEKEILENSLGIIKEEANSKEPKSKTISFALKTINSIKYVGELFILIQKLNEAIAPFLS